ncbi:MAG: cupin domain-containing protein [Thermoflexus sp.]|jgi:quercetin dioxygenase-like cupin family protein|nr:cupin domain-containing protein [Thermoflexus sp.]
MHRAHTDTLPGFRAGDLTLRPFTGERAMVVRVEAPASAVVPPHAHPHEQITLVIQGRLRLRMAGEEAELGPGEIVHIPAGVEHEVTFLEDALVFDVFQPPREDLLERLRMTALSG